MSKQFENMQSVGITCLRGSIRLSFPSLVGSYRVMGRTVCGWELAACEENQGNEKKKNSNTLKEDNRIDWLKEISSTAI